MLNVRELEAQAKALAPVMAEFVAESVAPVEKQLAAIAGRLEAVESIEIPKPDSVDLEVLAKSAADLIVIPDPIPGEPGKDADPELIKQLVSEAVAAIEIPAPKNGEPGKDGASVPLEDVQRMVDEAVAKAVAAISIPEPRNGEDGRDAIHLEILPAIDEQKSYARGTYAQHANGLWRAFERTSGLKGWECIVVGVQSMEIDRDGVREFSVKSVLSDGTACVKSFVLPVMLYKGIYKAGAEHVPGDTVTWGGSLWHCDEKTADKPGEVGSCGWSLCAKRGRDGKDGLNGKDLVSGVKIK